MLCMDALQEFNYTVEGKIFDKIESDEDTRENMVWAANEHNSINTTAFSRKFSKL